MEASAGRQVAVRIKRATFIACVPPYLPVRDVVEIADALLAAPVLAVALAGQHAAEAIAALRDRYGVAMTVGAADVLVHDELDAVLATGAGFVAAPRFEEAALRRCQQAGSLYLPAVSSAEDARQALAASVRLQRTSLAPAQLRGLRQAVPEVEFIAAGVIAEEMLAAYARAGAVAVELSAALFAGPTWSQAQIIRTARALRGIWELNTDGADGTDGTERRG